MSLLRRGKSAPKKKSGSKSRRKKRRTGPSSLWLGLLAGAVVVVILGVGLLKWSQTRSGRAALLTLGSEKMYADVQRAVDQALAETVPGYRPGPADASTQVGGTSKSGSGGGVAGDHDWDAPRLGPGAAVYCRQVAVPAGEPWWRWQETIARAVESAGGRVLWGERIYLPSRSGAPGRADEEKDLLRLDLGVVGRPTHTLILHRRDRETPVRWGGGVGQTAWSSLAADSGAPTVALVIDDWGYNRSDAARRILAVDAPLTLAVLPGLPYSRHFALQGTELILPADRSTGRAATGNRPATGRVQRLALGCFVEVGVESGRYRAQDDRREIILHLPMQPVSYPETDPGPEAIMVGMESQAIGDRLDRALASLPHVTGVNNHMGSAATSDPVTMDRLMGVLAARGLYFVDSLTTAKSVAHAAAAKAGVPARKNRIFLDYENDDPQRITANLHRLVKAARSSGFALGIGHPHPATADVLAREIPRLQAQGVRFVTVSELMALEETARSTR